VEPIDAPLKDGLDLLLREQFVDDMMLAVHVLTKEKPKCLEYEEVINTIT